MGSSNNHDALQGHRSSKTARIEEFFQEKKRKEKREKRLKIARWL
jgi:hypothetical protein